MRFQAWEKPMDNIKKFLRDYRDKADEEHRFDFATLDIAEDMTETRWVAEIIDANGNPLSHNGYPISAADADMFKAITKLDQMLAEAIAS